MMERNALLIAWLGTGSLLLRAHAQVTTAAVWLPMDEERSEITDKSQGSVVSSTGNVSVFAVSCTSGECHPFADGIGTQTYTIGPNTFIYQDVLQNSWTIDIRCSLDGCPVTSASCASSSFSGRETFVTYAKPTLTDRVALQLEHEVPEKTGDSCGGTGPAETESSGDRDEDEEADADSDADDDKGGGERAGNNGGDGEQDGDEGVAISLGPLVGLAAAGAVGAALLMM